MATRRRGRLWLVVAVAAVVATVAVVVVVSRPWTTETGLRAALRHAPADATFVAYTDWSALGHPDGYDIPLRLPGALAWAQFEAVQPPQVGIRSTQAQWELDVIDQAGRCVILQWPDPSGPNAIESGLMKYGWQASAQGDRTTLTNPSSPQDDQWTKQWGWALSAKFLIDHTSNSVVQCGRTDMLKPALDGSSDSFATLPSTRNLTDVSGTPVAAEFWSPDAICSGGR